MGTFSFDKDEVYTKKTTTSKSKYSVQQFDKLKEGFFGGSQDHCYNGRGAR